MQVFDIHLWENGLGLVGISLIYMGFLFLVATYGDWKNGNTALPKWRPTIYALTIAVYCTSWTFFGSVGVAARSGFDFLAVYIPPILLMTLGYPLLKRIIHLAKNERITSIADFLAARYGKKQTIAVIATIITVFGTIPYIALQLKALSNSFMIMVDKSGLQEGNNVLGDLPLMIAISMALFAMLFGARHTDATENQNGLMLAIATESIFKLFAFLVVGIYVTFFLFDGPYDLLRQSHQADILSSTLFQESDDSLWVNYFILSLLAFFLLPRQFHVMVVESNGGSEMRRAIWLFPLYLILINLFVVPIALAGILTFNDGMNADSFVLALPLSQGANLISLIAFLGGLSAATAMVIVATVALAIMVSNEIAIPFLVRHTSRRTKPHTDMYSLILNIRRCVILGIILLAYLYYRLAGDTEALISIGILSFVAIAQLAPSFFGGLFWKRATAKAALIAMVSGFVLWFYTLILPSFIHSGIFSENFLTDGPFHLSYLKPEALFGLKLSPLLHGTLLSLGINTILFVLVSLVTKQTPVERLQADTFTARNRPPTHDYSRWRTPVPIGKLTQTIGNYIGHERVARSFERYRRETDVNFDNNDIADIALLRFSEQLLTSAVGTASARLVMSLLITHKETASHDANTLLGDATAAIQYNRELLQVAIDEVAQGIAVFDIDLRLICWNRNFRWLLNLPVQYGEVGISLEAMLRHMAEKGEFGLGSIEKAIEERLASYSNCEDPCVERLAITQRAMEVRSKPMPGGRFVLSFNDITHRIETEEALTKANETLEARVKSRTEELTRLNEELTVAKARAEEANLGKTRFLTATGHDILQPLNAARLYTTALSDIAKKTEHAFFLEHAQKICRSLESVEDILGAVLDIGRLDTGVLKPNLKYFALQDVFDQLIIEFVPMAKEKGLDLKVIRTSSYVYSDERLLRRLLQNLLSNAIKYTKSGRILLGVRKAGTHVMIEVLDTGQGIPEIRKTEIFKEFHRLEQGARIAAGLGLGLSIVERISRVLNHTVKVQTKLDSGSRFYVHVPKGEKAELGADINNKTPLPRPIGHSLKGLTVLCIDNEPEILKGMEAMLRGWQCSVLVASSQEEVLALLSEMETLPNGIIADYHLDSGTGFDVIMECRNRYNTAFHGILVTANRSRTVIDLAEKQNINVLHKPLKPASLRALLSQWKQNNINENEAAE